MQTVELEFEEAAKIRSFFDAADHLKKAEIIRSSRFAGDIAEYLCSKLFALELEEDLRNVGFDARDKDGKCVEIKAHFSRTRTNIQNVNFSRCDYLYVVISHDSFINPLSQPEGTYSIYRIDKSDLPRLLRRGSCSKVKKNGNINISKKTLEAMSPVVLFNV